MKPILSRLLMAAVLSLGVLAGPSLVSASPAPVVALLQAPGEPSMFMVLLAAVLRIVIPVAAAWLFTEYSKGVEWLNKLGDLGVGLAGVFWGALGTFLTGKIPGFELPPNFSEFTVGGIASFLSGLVTLITHVQSTAMARASARRSRGLKY